MRDLLDRLRTIESRQRALCAEYAAVIRAIVAKAGGVGQAATLLGLDPKTVRARERAAGVVMVVYRGGRTAKAGPGGRQYGETGHGEDGEDSRARLDADRTGFTVARDKRALLRAVVYVVDGRVVRVREVRDGPWYEDARGKVVLPLGPPLTSADLSRRLPTLPLALGDRRPMVRGRIREHIAL